MPIRSYTSRRELEQHSFHPAVTLLVPFAAVLLQAFLPRSFHYFDLIDLPLLVNIFFAVSRRSPIAGTLTGAAIGLLQDTLTAHPIGVNGMAKAVIGFAAASIGVQIDVENLTTRILMSFCFSILNSLLLFLIDHRLLGLPGAGHLRWIHELISAFANTLIALPLFFMLDRAQPLRLTIAVALITRCRHSDPELVEGEESPHFVFAVVFSAPRPYHRHHFQAHARLN